MNATGLLPQCRGGGQGDILSGNKGPTPLLRRPAEHSVGVKFLKEHVEVKGVSKHGAREPRSE